MGQFRRQKVTDPIFTFIKTNQGRNAFSGSVLSLRNRCTAFMVARRFCPPSVKAGNDLAGRSKRRSARRNAMFRLINYGLVRSISLSALLLSVSAMGQFEVAPDHFDSTSKTETVRRAATKSPAKHKVLAGAQANRRHTAGTSRSSVSTTAQAHVSTKKTQPKTTAALGRR